MDKRRWVVQKGVTHGAAKRGNPVIRKKAVTSNQTCDSSTQRTYTGSRSTSPIRYDSAGEFVYQADSAASAAKSATVPPRRSPAVERESHTSHIVCLGKPSYFGIRAGGFGEERGDEML